MSDLVHCLECDHLWFEQHSQEDCPECGSTCDNSAYVEESSETYKYFIQEMKADAGEY